jgi:hypothetical protein
MIFLIIKERSAPTSAKVLCYLGLGGFRVIFEVVNRHHLSNRRNPIFFVEWCRCLTWKGFEVWVVSNFGQDAL